MKKLKLKFLPLVLSLAMFITAMAAGCSINVNVADSAGTTSGTQVTTVTTDNSADEDAEDASSDQSLGDALEEFESVVDDIAGEIESQEAEKNSSGDSGQSAADSSADVLSVDEDGEYTSKEEVAAYLNEYGHLPSNYITKSEAKELGWNSGDNSTLDKVAPGKSIGGDKFGNNEGLLPKASGRQYYECDIDYVKGGRNAKRIIYSNDGLIYYTEDHYESFELLYGEE